MTEKTLSATQTRKIKQAHTQLQHAIHLIVEVTQEDIPTDYDGDYEHWLDDIAEPLYGVAEDLDTLVEATEKIDSGTALLSRVTERSALDA
jgi:hypothetical protein